MVRAAYTPLLLVAFASCASQKAVVSPSKDNVRDVSELVSLEGDSIVVKESISFAHGSADIEPKSFDLLDAVAGIINSHDSIHHLLIEGHTDTTGEPDGNQPLSASRARAVKKYLEGKGVAPNRLEAKGFGSTQPVDSNDTEAGRARNRRVEFKVK